MSRARRTAAAVALAAAAALVAGCAPGRPPAASSAPATGSPAPAAVAVVGDSISLGVNACDPQQACPAVSWATGTDASVDSIVQRLTAASGTVPATTVLARAGANVSEAAAALGKSPAIDADLVLVLLGANDACTASVSAVTPVDRFAASYARVLDDIHAAAPAARVVAYSVPDLLHLWELGRTDPRAVALWNASRSCRSLLADADSDSAADTARRTAIGATITGYNAAIAAACARVSWCTSDDGALAATEFTAEDVSDVDYFHPSAAGQAALAAGAWPAVEAALRG